MIGIAADRAISFPRTEPRRRSCGRRAQAPHRRARARAMGVSLPRRRIRREPRDPAVAANLRRSRRVQNAAAFPAGMSSPRDSPGRAFGTFTARGIRPRYCGCRIDHESTVVIRDRWGEARACVTVAPAIARRRKVHVRASRRNGHMQPAEQRHRYRSENAACPPARSRHFIRHHVTRAAPP